MSIPVIPPGSIMRIDNTLRLFVPLRNEVPLHTKIPEAEWIRIESTKQVLLFEPNGVFPGIDRLMIIDTNEFPDVRICVLTVGENAKIVFEQLACSLVVGDYHLGNDIAYRNAEIDVALEELYPNGTKFSVEGTEQIITKPDGEVKRRAIDAEK